MNEGLDKEQSQRIARLEDRVNMVENDLSAILAKLEVSQTLLKTVAILAGAALGIDVIPMVGGA
jgi:hypothetical protein|tara:strand:+ start:705 stop:896 length:192 start_codon:yes stop_codon:yes gene_type:complete